MHFAGLIRADESVEQPDRYRDFNFLKAKKFLETCFENNLKKVIFSSTAVAYGNPKNDRVAEEDPLNPYAASKLELENFIKESTNKYNSKYIILRYFNVAGADKKMRTGLISKVSTHLIKIASEVATKKKRSFNN
jgi:UDP-glucose 4-epimerase